MYEELALNRNVCLDHTSSKRNYAAKIKTEGFVLRVFFAGFVRFENRFVRPGLHAASRSGPPVRLAFELRRHRSHVARRLHHS